MPALRRRMSWSSSWPKRARPAMILAASVSSSTFGHGSTNTAAKFSNRNAVSETRATGAESGLQWTRASRGRCRKCSCVCMKKGWSIGGIIWSTGTRKTGRLCPTRKWTMWSGKGTCGISIIRWRTVPERLRSPRPARKRCWGIRRSPYIPTIRAIPTSSGRRWCFRLWAGKFPLLRTSMSKWISAAGR